MGRAFGVEIEHVPVRVFREPALELHQRQIFRARVQTMEMQFRLCGYREGGKVSALISSVDPYVELVGRGQQPVRFHLRHLPGDNRESVGEEVRRLAQGKKTVVKDRDFHGTA